MRARKASNLYNIRVISMIKSFMIKSLLYKKGATKELVDMRELSPTLNIIRIKLMINK